MMRGAKMDTIVQVPVRKIEDESITSDVSQMDHVIKIADESITSPKFT